MLQDLDELSENVASSVELQQLAKECAGYFRIHRKRMDYPRDRHLGLCSSSVLVESMYKHIIDKRLKGSGQRWRIENANAIATLRLGKRRSGPILRTPEPR